MIFLLLSESLSLTSTFLVSFNFSKFKKRVKLLYAKPVELPYLIGLIIFFCFFSNFCELILLTYQGA